MHQKFARCRPLLLLCACLFAAMHAFALLVVSAAPAHALEPAAAQSKPQTPDAPPPPQHLTPETARDYVSRLSDEQARKLLLQKLDTEVPQSSTGPDESSLRVAGRTVLALVAEIRENVLRVPQMPSVLATSAENFLAGRPAGAAVSFVLYLAAAIGAGLIAAAAINTLAKYANARIASTHPTSLKQSISLLVSRLALELAGLTAFVCTALLFSLFAFGHETNELFTATLVIIAAAAVWLVWLVARFLFAPKRADLRLCPLTDSVASLLVRRSLMVATILAIGDILFRWTSAFGFAGERTGLAFWPVTIAYALAAATIWNARHALSQMLIDTRENGESPNWINVAGLWPALAVVMIVAQWLVAALLVATGHVDKVSLPALHITLGLVALLPVIELAIRPLVSGLFPTNRTQNQMLQAAHVQTQRGLVRISRTVAALVIFFVLLRLWNVDVLSIAQRGVGERLAGALFEIVLLVLVAYGAWEAVRIWTERQLAIEHARLRAEQADDSHGDTLEGGREGSRILTLYPLLRWTAQIFIVVFAALAILGALGINTGPLLAGAGIVGVAVGFGSQALVRDIISGIFFLADDAFRRGEYVEVGPVKGTVENISIRSMQLRHQNGPLNTIPFGEIKHLKNYSRDWVIMKLPLRLTFDTDVDKVRKLIKDLGKKLLADPEIGPKFIQPLKSQGVIEMDDSAMIIRVKFMTRPGDQWPIRSKVYAEIRSLFEREGIHFASREVRVRVSDQDAEASPGNRTAAIGAAASRAAIAAQQQPQKVNGDTL